ncbi:hypothetical protein ACFL6S_14430 [Candidatus Poribacteria bacterium]
MARNSMAWLIRSLRLKVNDEGPRTLDSDEHYLGDSIKLTCTYLDDNGVATDPTSPTISVWDPEGTKLVDSVTPTNSGTGVYYYNYRIPEAGPEGVWIAEFTGVVNGTIREYPKEFEAMIAKRIWTDDELQNYLDMYRIHIRRELLRQDVDEKVFSSKFGMFENDITLWDNGSAGAIQVTPDSSNLVDGLFTFVDGQDCPYYLDGKSYNIHGAIAECMEQLAMDPNKAKEWGRGGVKYTHYDLMEMARYHRNLVGTNGTTVVKTYRT